MSAGVPSNHESASHYRGLTRRSLLEYEESYPGPSGASSLRWNYSAAHSLQLRVRQRPQPPGACDVDPGFSSSPPHVHHEDVAPAHPRQVERGGRADDAGADDHEAGVGNHGGASREGVGDGGGLGVWMAAEMEIYPGLSDK